MYLWIMDKNELMGLETLVHSTGWKTLTKLWEEEIDTLTESLCNSENNTMEIVRKLRAERTARIKLIELPTLTLQEFKTEEGQY